ncbi:leucyl-tRNA synthetase [Spiroplasma sp. TIUS-1]|uniref:leucine--tRNA ligase n=1 Tax=Spiroplasma sp. TIUS-1 TaxID=216963 RepID=UPI00139878E0|nr:leucine--tRNA ligase [Spiroplasma sp. TIUS-1]QHX35685.1 leucyl-tRNA synthetase [Spiroplasma sp. TIUS-1]
MEFSHKAIEKKWQVIWKKNNAFATKDNSDKKAYILDMFPYPSGAGLHVGHTKGYTATDIYSRFKRLNGYDVLHPMGYDAFGLPAEQYALKTGNDPRDFTIKNIEVFRTQLEKMGYSYDPNKEVITSDPNYYKITQQIFIKLYKKGLAEIRNVNVNWCPELGTALANEEVINKDGKMISEVGGFEVFKKPMRQWVLKITDYAERLLKGLDNIDMPKSIKDLQKNWIGKSEGAIVEFDVKNSEKKLNVFTTRIDTIYGVTYLVVAPENEIVSELTTEDNKKDVDEYVSKTLSKSDIERQDESKPKSGVFIGSYAINPITKEEIPVWISDYVLNDYATGVIMAVPAHDPRDWEFAKKFKLPIKFVLKADDESKAFIGKSEYINSKLIEGMDVIKAKDILIKFLAEYKKASVKVNYKLRDWLFSRQRFYGEPFPVAFDNNQNIVLLEKSLPVELPKTDYIKPSGTGESPLANIKDWLNIEVDGKKLVRETNTMPQSAASSWYHLAYILAKAPNQFTDLESPEAMKLFKKWLPVDLYIGGQEHAVGHLLYIRFWHQVLFDLGIVPTQEPFNKLINQGMVLDNNGTKMSKSKGNVVNPDDIIESHGADALRLFIAFMGPIEASLQWSEDGLDSSRKWIDRVYRMINTFEITNKNDGSLEVAYNKMVKNFGQMINDYKFNTAISQLMVFVNEVYAQQKPIYIEYLKNFLIMLSIITPHVCEELWEKLNQKGSVCDQTWPKFDESKLIENTVTIAVQINGKLRATFKVNRGTKSPELLKTAKLIDLIKNQLEDKTLIKEIAVPDRIVNFVIK